MPLRPRQVARHLGVGMRLPPTGGARPARAGSTARSVMQFAPDEQQSRDAPAAAGREAVEERVDEGDRRIVASASDVLPGLRAGGREEWRPSARPRRRRGGCTPREQRRRRPARASPAPRRARRDIEQHRALNQDLETQPAEPLPFGELPRWLQAALGLIQRQSDHRWRGCEAIRIRAAEPPNVRKRGSIGGDSEVEERAQGGDVRRADAQATAVSKSPLAR